MDGWLTCFVYIPWPTWGVITHDLHSHWSGQTSMLPLFIFFVTFDMVVSHWPSASHQLSHVLNYVLTFVLRSRDQLVVWSLYCQWERMLTPAAEDVAVAPCLWDILESFPSWNRWRHFRSAQCIAGINGPVGKGLHVSSIFSLNWGAGWCLREAAGACWDWLCYLPRLLYFSPINSGRSGAATSSHIYLPWCAWPGCSVWYWLRP